jgi:O-antigen/teichoic acid export membrane protein
MRNPLRNRFVRHVTMTGGAQVLQAAFAMAAGILVARALGAPARGTLAVLTALGSITILLGSLGIHLSGVYFLGRFKEEHDSVISNNLLVGAIGGIGAALGLAGVGLAFQGALLHGIGLDLFAIFLFSVPLLYFNQFGRTLLLGAGRVGGYNVPDLLGGSALLVGTAGAIVVFGHELTPLVALKVVVEVAITVVTVAMLRRSVRFRFSPSRALLRRQLRYGLRNYTGTLFWLCLLQSDIVLCNRFLGTGPTGVYSVAVALGLPITLLAGAVGTLTFQRVSAQESRATRIAQTNRTARVLLPLATLGAIALGLLAHVIVTLVYGREFEDAAPALILLLPGLLAFSVEVVLMNFLAGEGSPPIMVYGPAVGLCVNFVANLFVIPRWGINGASVTSSVAYAIVLLMVLRYYLRSTSSTVAEVLAARRDDVTALFGAPDAGPA